MSKWIRLLGLVGAVALTAACFHRPPQPPGPALDHHLQVYVKDQANQAILTASVWRGDDLPIHVGDDGGAAWQILGAGFDVCADAPGYVQACVRIDQFEDQVQTITLSPDPVPEPPAPDPIPDPIPLPARPSFPPVTSDGEGTWSAGPYATTLPWPLDPAPSIDLHRGDFSGLRVPQCRLPQLEAGINGWPDHVMTWDLPQYGPYEQACILKAYKARGYTHLVVSIPQARNWGVLDARFINTAQHVGSVIPYVVVIVYGGDGEDWDDVRPWLDQLAQAQAVHEVVVCWQCDFRYTPAELARRTIQLSEWAHPKGIKVSQHWVNEAAAWWNAADDPREDNTCNQGVGPAKEPVCNRFDYHRVMAQWVDYQYLQVDVNAPIEDPRPRAGGVAGAIRDVLRSLTTERLVIAEYHAQRDFDRPELGELQGLLKGYLLMCVGVRGGFMDGAAWLD